MEALNTDEEVPFEYNIFGLALTEPGAISYFAENLPSDMVGMPSGHTGLHEFYESLLIFYEKTGLDPVDPIALMSWLETETDIPDSLGGPGGVKIFLDIVSSIELSNPESVAKILRYRANKRKQMDSLQELQRIISKKAHKTEEDIESISSLTEQIRALENDLDYDPFSDVTTATDISNRVDELLEIPDFLPTQFKALNRALGYTDKGGFFKGAVHAVVAQSGKGKALALNTPIPTPDGWTTMGDLKTGDIVIGSDGKPCNVVNVSQVFENHDCYLVVFSDGSRITADAEHQWEIERPSSWRSAKIRTTAELYQLISKGTIRVPIQKALDLPHKDLDIDPYVLGAWLGDGHSAGARITCSDEDIQIIEEIKKTESINYRGNLLYNITEGNGSGNVGSNPFVVRLRELDLLNNKHIPNEYLRSSAEQRLALLQGLMDTDGSAYKNGSGITLEFCNTNYNLVCGVLELVRSLGITANCAVGRAKINGKDCGPKYKIQFITNLPVFRLRRKLERQQAWTGKGYRRTIRSVTPINSVPTKCIEVDSPDHLYLAGLGMVPTHNSTFTKTLCNHWLDEGHTVLFINFEEAQAHWERILFTQTIRQNVYEHAENWTEEERQEKLAVFKERLDTWGDRLMVRHHPDSSYFDDLERWLRDIIGHNEVVPDVVVIDTIQSLLSKKGGPRWEGYENMMIRLERLAKDMGAVFILTAQQNTMQAKEKREIVEQYDVGGSIAIVQKCSVSLIITPKKMAGGDESESDFLMEIQIPKSRITGSNPVYNPPLVMYNDETKSYEDFQELDNLDIYDNEFVKASEIFGEDFFS